MAVLHNSIADFRSLIADKMAHSCWPSLADELRLEQRRLKKPIREALENTVISAGLSMAAWDDINEVGDFATADLHLSRDVSTQAILQLAKGQLPIGLVHIKSNTQSMLQCIDKKLDADVIECWTAACHVHATQLLMMEYEFTFELLVRMFCQALQSDCNIDSKRGSQDCTL